MLYLNQFLSYVIFALIAFMYMTIAKLIRDKMTSFDDDIELEENSNFAVGTRLFGLFIGIAVAMAAALTGPSRDLLQDVITFLYDGALAVLYLLLAQAINDKLILSRFDNDKEVARGNSAVALIEVGSYIATGFILNGALSGEGGGFWSVLVFALLGQVTFLLFYAVYNAVTKFDVNVELGRTFKAFKVGHNNKAEEYTVYGNTSAGLAVAGNMIALGIILRAAIAGPFNGWVKDITGFGISALFGIILLVIFRKLADRVMLPHTTLYTEVGRDQNFAAVFAVQGVLIAVAIVVAALIM